MGALAMTDAEREQFLADLHVGVIAVEQPGRSPLTVPIWYDYEPGGEVTILTGSNSVKARLLTAAQRFSLCVQVETPPYRYVSVEGPVTSSQPVDVERDIRPMAIRYLGERDGDAYVKWATASLDEVRITMRPERWLSQDYTKIATE
jgi:hypothetical protein